MDNQFFSPFQIHGTRITDLSVSNPFISLADNELELNISITNGDIKIQERGDELQSTLTQTVKVVAEEKNNNKKKMEISISVEGFFTLKGHDKKLFADMLALNGNSSLYSVVRSYIITVSSLALNQGTITLPMVNFFDLLEAMKDEK